MSWGGARIEKGWQVVGAAFVVAIFGWGFGFYGPPIFLHQVVVRTGWPLEWVAAAVTFHFIFGAFVVAWLPRLYRLIGLPLTTATGALCLALGTIGWSLADAPWQLLAACMLTGGGWVTMGAAALNAIVSPWFSKRRPAAFSMAYNGATLGGILMPPIWVALIAAVGFSGAALSVGAVMLVLVVGLSITLLKWAPEGGDEAFTASSTSAASDGSDRFNPWQDRRFLTLAAAMALGLFAQVGILAHIVSILVPRIGVEGAGWAMAMATAAALAGRMVLVWTLPPEADRRFVAAAGYAVQGLGVALLALGGDGLAPTIAGVLLFGSGIGNATSLPPLIAQKEFPAHQVARVVPLIVALSQDCYALAPAVFGVVRVFDSANDAGGFWVAGVCLTVQGVAIVCFLLGRLTSGAAREAKT